MIGIYQHGILKTVPNIEEFLGHKVVLNPKKPDALIAIAGWGYKETSQKAIQKAREWNLPYWALEEGFIRDYEGFTSPVSLVIDPIGIYYDPTKPSLLENLLNFYEPMQEELETGRRIRKWIIKNKVSKYNNYKPLDKTLLSGWQERVLVVDQTYKDMSVVLCGADEKTFREMLECAIYENPQAKIYVKLHPMVYLGKKRGYLQKVKSNDRIKVIWENFNPIQLLEHMDKVYTVSSQMGFEAILLEKEVHCFGLPFYAGWGLTRDRIKCDRRKRRLSVDKMVFMVYNIYMKWRRGFKMEG